MDSILFSSAARLARMIHAGELSAEEAAAAHLARIRQLNPHLNAVVEIMPDALESARQADADLAAGRLRSPLHGVPFTVKDVFATAGFATALDRQMRQRTPAPDDATVVARLREAGAVLLAKTNCPPTGSGSDAENSLTGRTVNPYRPGHATGGSSGGEAALVAACGSPLGLGSDGSGGLRVPAHYCGIAALKPTAGRVPNSGAYNQPGGLTDPRTQIGPLARTVEDLALVMPLLIGPDELDSGVVPMPWADPAAVDLAGLRVAYFIEDPDSPVAGGVADRVAETADALARAGVEVTQARPKEILHAAREIDRLWQDRAGSTGRTLVEVYALWDDYRMRMLWFMGDYDAVLCPADHHPAPPHRERDPRRFDYTLPFSLTGYPSVVVRAGAAAGGLPIGVQIAARPWREDVALALAMQVERDLGGWQPVP